MHHVGTLVFLFGSESNLFRCQETIKETLLVLFIVSIIDTSLNSGSCGSQTSSKGCSISILSISLMQIKLELTSGDYGVSSCYSSTTTLYLSLKLNWAHTTRSK